MVLLKFIIFNSKNKSKLIQNVYLFSNIPNHWESHSYKWNKKDDDVSQMNRMRAITSYYYQSAIDVAASKQSVRLTPTSLLYTGHNADRNHILRSAQYLHRELPVRIAHRIAGFRSLPFIVAINPTVLSVHELYINSFKTLSQYPTIKTEQDEDKYSELLKTLLDNHKDVLTNLAQGLKESQRHVTDNLMIKSILDRTLTSRLGVRMLAEHHLALKENRPNHVGIINISFSPKTLIESHAEHVGENFFLQYGCKPLVIINGQTDITFPYIRQPLDYIVNELLKNAFRATIEANRDKSSSLLSNNLPPIVVTICSNDDDFILRISDQGRGIPKAVIKRIWDYHFSCNHWRFINDDYESDIDQNSASFDYQKQQFYHEDVSSVFGQSNESNENSKFNERSSEDSIGLSQISQDKLNSPMHGFGFGLPTSKAYAEYLGGSLKLESIRGHGTDVYLCLRHMDGKSESFRI